MENSVREVFLGVRSTIVYCLFPTQIFYYQTLHEQKIVFLRKVDMRSEVNMILERFRMSNAEKSSTFSPLFYSEVQLRGTTTAVHNLGYAYPKGYVRNHNGWFKFSWIEDFQSLCLEMISHNTWRYQPVFFVSFWVREQKKVS